MAREISLCICVNFLEAVRCVFVCVLTVICHTFVSSVCEVPARSASHIIMQVEIGVWCRGVGAFTCVCVCMYARGRGGPLL